MSKQSKRASGKTAGGTRRQLAEYRDKRNFDITPEPGVSRSKSRAQSKKSALTFVIQKHAASRLHYDFRLEWDGVLKSWAVAKGPSYYPGDKRLAVQVEDHPLDYGGFEGIIPKGQYGGGTVLLWDRGTWEPMNDAAEGLQNGNLKFTLRGKKLRGNWALIRMGGRLANPAKPNWLLIKERDEYARGASDIPVTEEEPDSVLSGRDMDSIAEAKDAVWNSREGASIRRTSSIGRKATTHRKSTRSKASTGAEQAIDTIPPSRARVSAPRQLAAQFAKAPREALPPFFPPQLASLAASPPTGGDWIHELKLDGYRMQARIQTDAKRDVKLLTRTAQDWTHRMSSIAEAAAALPVRGALLDGEVVVLDSHGLSSFASLQAAFHEGARYALTYFVFDLLHWNGRSLRNLPLIERKKLLAELFARLPPDGPIRMSEHLNGDGSTVFAHACKLGAEGIVSKLAQGRYISGRSNGWLKSKCYREQELVIGGFTLPSNGTHGVGALLLGYYKKGKLIYAGRTGTGFTRKTHHMMRERLEAIARKTSPFADLPDKMSRGAHWTKPTLVAQVTFAAWTADNLVRQAAFKGLREDKPAKAVHREEEKQMPGEHEVATKNPKAAQSSIKARAAKRSEAAEQPKNLLIRLTHPDKVLDLKSGLTKGELAQYYSDVAAHMLPHIAGRPLSLVRCLNGSAKRCFFQKHTNDTLPPDIESVDIVDKKTGKPEPYITLHTAESLVELAQLSVMEIHAWGSENESLEKPDHIVIDLDPDIAIGWQTLAAAATEVRQRMKAAGLEPFLKATGGKGLHVVAPIRPEHEWPAVKDFAHKLVLAMEADSPQLYLTRMTKSARKGKIYLDYLRNERGATSIAPYSPRARDGAPVALPLSWSELKSPRLPLFFVSDFFQWKHRLRTDPWKEMEQAVRTLKI